MRDFKLAAQGDIWGGALMIGIGGFAFYQGLSYQVGTLAEMGPGFFPVALGVLLIAIGIGIVLTQSSSLAVKKPAWARLPRPRAFVPILGSIAAFVVIGRFGGLVPATFAIVFISAFADRQNTLKGSLLLAFAMTAICVAVFWWALSLQFPLFQWG